MARQVIPLGDPSGSSLGGRFRRWDLGETGPAIDSALTTEAGGLLFAVAGWESQGNPISFHVWPGDDDSQLVAGVHGGLMFAGVEPVSDTIDLGDPDDSRSTRLRWLRRTAILDEAVASENFGRLHILSGSVRIADQNNDAITWTEAFAASGTITITPADSSIDPFTFAVTDLTWSSSGNASTSGLTGWSDFASDLIDATDQAVSLTFAIAGMADDEIVAEAARAPTDDRISNSVTVRAYGVALDSATRTRLSDLLETGRAVSLVLETTGLEGQTLSAGASLGVARPVIRATGIAAGARLGEAEGRINPLGAVGLSAGASLGVARPVIRATGISAGARLGEAEGRINPLGAVGLSAGASLGEAVGKSTSVQGLSAAARLGEAEGRINPLGAVGISAGASLGVARPVVRATGLSAGARLGEAEGRINPLGAVGLSAGARLGEAVGKRKAVGRALVAGASLGVARPVIRATGISAGARLGEAEGRINPLGAVGLSASASLGEAVGQRKFVGGAADLQYSVEPVRSEVSATAVVAATAVDQVRSAATIGGT